MEMWNSSTFSKSITAKIKIPGSYVTPGNKNYLFMESNMMIDGYPAGKVLKKNLDRFNSVMHIEWFRY
jgi:hypothetical protein